MIPPVIRRVLISVYWWTVIWRLIWSSHLLLAQLTWRAKVSPSQDSRLCLLKGGDWLDWGRKRSEGQNVVFRLTGPSAALASPAGGQPGTRRDSTSLAPSWRRRQLPAFSPSVDLENFQYNHIITLLTLLTTWGWHSRACHDSSDRGWQQHLTMKLSKQKYLLTLNLNTGVSGKYWLYDVW